jgi:hypothetical protein
VAEAVEAHAWGEPPEQLGFRGALARLQAVAARVSEIVEFRVEPLQVAALLVERDLDRLDDRAVVEAVRSAARKHP